ncbi:hypothetical protein [Streptomyces sp. JW3]|uniref:hypothetical protein n=1 Tax=Streptomyces sp. JW3 TaxID=3456955 RepID=UPI003FA4B15A
MTSVRGSASPDTAAQQNHVRVGRLIGAGLIFVGVVLLALGAYLGPYTYATSTPGKLTVDTCTVEYKYSGTSSKTRKKTKTRYCYGTFTAADGSHQDLNAELRSDALYQGGDVLAARRTGDTSYQMDHGWTGAIAVGCAWLSGTLIALAIGVSGALTGFASGRAADRKLFRGAITVAMVGVVGLVVSLLIVFFA